jgi:hypothetical protein
MRRRDGGAMLGHVTRALAVLGLVALAAMAPAASAAGAPRGFRHVYDMTVSIHNVSTTNQGGDPSGVFGSTYDATITVPLDLDKRSGRVDIRNSADFGNTFKRSYRGHFSGDLTFADGAPCHYDVKGTVPRGVWWTADRRLYLVPTVVRFPGGWEQPCDPLGTRTTTLVVDGTPMPRYMACIARLNAKVRRKVRRAGCRVDGSASDTRPDASFTVTRTGTIRVRRVAEF